LKSKLQKLLMMFVTLFRHCSQLKIVANVFHQLYFTLFR